MFTLWLHKRFKFETFTFFLTLGILILGIGLAETNGEMTYRGFGYFVDSCPTNETEFITAATRLNCSEDQFGRNQYTCVPNEDISTLVEFCYSKIVGFYQKGNCLVTTGYGALDQISCQNFTTGCPAANFRGTDLYKFSACSKINTEDQCFYADPSCPNITESTTVHPSTTADFLKTTTNATMNILTTETSTVDQLTMIIGIAIAFGVILLLSLVLIIKKVCEKRKLKTGNQEDQIEMRLMWKSGCLAVPVVSFPVDIMWTLMAIGCLVQCNNEIL